MTEIEYLDIAGILPFNRLGSPGIFHPVGTRGTAVGGMCTRSGCGAAAPRRGGSGPVILPTSAEIAIQRAL